MEAQKQKKSVAQLEAELKEARESERIEKLNHKKVYEDLKAETVLRLVAKAYRLSLMLAGFKKDAFDDMQTVYAILQEYSSRHADGKGNFRIEHEGMRVTYKRQGKATFDERSHQAEKHIIDFVNSKFADDQDTRDLIMSLLERKKGELDIHLVQKLYAMENRFNDNNWKRGIELLKESYQYSHSKDYINFEKRDENGQWQTINLQFSNI
ncbi:MAG: DUF3164 family protein [Flavobacterium sp.]|uniref:DUF3164 family protein n=1 Tax=Flavobacterium sp. UBA4197 TaxID=1946546 RepID=UPI0012CB4A09|nr:DUF3164 family protein [Flavobacterium sp. UBA4197]MPT33785.1 DUF3164 family protein [Flavobacterium sp.]